MIMAGNSKYARYFALAKERGLTDENRRDLVRQFTYGRTDSLAELSHKEYYTLCGCLEHNCSRADYENRVDKLRHNCIRLMDKIGISPWWSARDEFCCDPRIAGKKFSYLDLAELAGLHNKLHAIRNKQRKQRNTMSAEAATVLYPNFRKNDVIS